ncbi:hypothetical protein GIB67_039717 [Kingdonia uniflora]|uniref:Uncharacterized protein n=1 Tax=Kingdonia uniflora TaxID=39325 RepID=A0A7J7MPZ4_9MAGN|nr:hypothetical protein GIB67_039717 [Kingdonia uniflora]
MVLTSSCAKADEVDLVGHLSPVIGVGDEEDTIAKLVEWPRLKGSRVKYPTGFSRFREFCKAKSSIDGIWGHTFGYRGNFFRTCSVSQGGDYLYLLPDFAKRKKCRHLGDEVSLEYVQDVVKDSRTDGFYSYLAQFDYELTLPLSNLAKSVMNMIGACPRSDEEPLELNNRTLTKVSRKESFIDAAAREGIELEAVLKELEISRFKRVASKDDKVRRSQAKRRMVAKTSGSMEEKLSTPELSTPLKLTRLNKMLDGPVDMPTVSSTVVQNLAKRKAIKRGAASCSVTSDSVDNSSKRRKVASPTKSQVVPVESDKIVEGADFRPRFEVEAGLLEEQCRAKAREKMVAVMDDEFKKEREAFQLELEKEKEAAALKLKEVRAESVAEVEQLVTAPTTSQKNLAGKLYQLRYTKAEIMAFSKGNYEEKEIMDEEEVEEMEDGLNVEKLVADNQEIINQKELDAAREREEQTLLYNTEYAEEYEALISQYEDRLDDNVKLSLKLEEAKRQVEDKTAIILSRDSDLNQLTSKLVELKEKAASGSRHEAELAEYHIKPLNEEISDMKCNIRALNELDHSKADLRRLKGRDAQSRADLVEIQAKNKSLVDDLAYARGNMRRVV